MDAKFMLDQITDFLIMLSEIEPNANEPTDLTIARKVWITSSELLSEIVDLLPSNKGRLSLVTSLIKAYGLDSKCEDIIGVGRVRRHDLESFHGKQFLSILLKNRPSIDVDHVELEKIRETLQIREYKDIPKTPGTAPKEHIDIIKLGDELGDKYNKNQINDISDSDLELSEINDEIILVEHKEQEEDNTELENFGLTHDCYIFPFMAEYVNLVAASSIHSASRLTKERKESVQNVVINWYGGRHHCKKNKAAGFCYINDIVLSINILRRNYRRIFYLDLDLHHGDGVESAFEFSKNVMTCSIHRYDIGFYPGTGSLSSTQKTKVNIPVMRGLSDGSMLRIVKDIVLPLIMNFGPDALVIQAGCDGLSTDEHKEWNMTIKGYGKVLRLLLNSVANTPVMILGGGGYNHSETAKCWTYLTSIALRLEKLSDEWDLIPDHKYLDAYQNCGFQFWTNENLNSTKLMKDENDNEYVAKIKAYILDKCI